MLIEEQLKLFPVIYLHSFSAYISLNFPESRFAKTKMHKSQMKLSKSSMTYMRGIDRFLSDAFADGNQGNKILYPCKKFYNFC